MEIAIAVLAAFAIQLGSHYLPWARILGKPELPRLLAYTIGTATIGVIITIWTLAMREYQTLIIFWSVTLASGAGVASGYALDWILNNRDRAHEAESREELEHEQIERLR